jgi:hypothetical protein
MGFSLLVELLKLRVVKRQRPVKLHTKYPEVQKTG